MVDLVTLERVKQALRIGDIDVDGLPLPSEDDDLLQAYISAASQAIIRYLKGHAKDVLGLDDDGELPPDVDVPEDVQVACIMLVGHFYREPDGNPDRAFEDGYLPRPVTSLLYSLRDPALA